MRVFTAVSIFILIIICGGQAINVYASTDDSSIKPIVKRAFDAQVQLSEKERSLNEINELMEPYFTKKFIPLFLKENLVKTDHGYQTFGTDFPLYYIPFFSYDEYTKVVKDGNCYYVVESINHHQEGPVKYEKDYKGVRLIHEDGKWKVDEVLDKIPPKIVKQIESKQKGTTGTNGSIVHSFSTLNENMLLNHPLKEFHHRFFSYHSFLRII
ncbi:hypothetical protein B5V89_16145 [Heyndrickxia sporothermodurans]|uniref:DUF3993 domain-containing protein n=1 Tax=Heyndrickxia TaxID=2837504 RepID=UPI000D3BD9A8|nr:DUF3993 domain-containing protein [Heyndrickxia sporothermodurans]PTY77004.1 hypothetical protein B5V89_16145 [Heyndrickxia sporothermodurans]